MHTHVPWGLIFLGVLEFSFQMGKAGIRSRQLSGASCCPLLMTPALKLEEAELSAL